MITFTYRYNRTVKYFRYLNLERGPNREAHHIIPRSCNGTNEQDNILIVPARWHYILHCWLPFVYLEQNNQEAYNKMLAAWHRMNNFKSEFRSDLKNLKIDSKLYEELRLRHSNYLKEVMPEKQAGSKNSNYGKHWWKDPNDRTKYKSFRDDEEIPEGWIRGRWFSDNGLKNIKSSASFSSVERIWMYNPLNNEHKLIKRSDEEVLQQLFKDGWENTRKPPVVIYTSNGNDRLKLKSTETPPENFIKISEWKKHSKKYKTKEEIEAIKECAKQKVIKANHEKHEKWVNDNIEIWKEMYHCYLENGWDFMKQKYNYQQGEKNFLRIIRVYLPDVFKWKQRFSKRSKRGPYKNKK